MTGSLYSKFKKETTIINNKEIADIINNLFFQALSSSLQRRASKSPTGKPTNNNIK